jgi:hypothetical protein
MTDLSRLTDLPTASDLRKCSQARAQAHAFTAPYEKRLEKLHDILECKRTILEVATFGQSVASCAALSPAARADLEKKGYRTTLVVDWAERERTKVWW